MTTPPLLERYFAQAHNKYNGTLDDCYNRLQRRITEQARCLIQDIRAAVPVENRSREVTRAPQLTDALTSQLDRTESILQDAQTVVQELKGL